MKHKTLQFSKKILPFSKIYCTFSNKCHTASNKCQILINATALTHRSEQALPLISDAPHYLSIYWKSDNNLTVTKLKK